MPLTSNLDRAGAPGNVQVDARAAGLLRDSVANVSLVAAIDRGLLTERIGRVPGDLLAGIVDGVMLVMGR